MISAMTTATVFGLLWTSSHAGTSSMGKIDGSRDAVFETLAAPLSLVPSKGGSVMRVETIPPDESWRGRVSEKDIQAYFASLNALGASAFHAKAPHPYLQETPTLDFCIVLEGELVLVLDTEEVLLRPGHVVIQRGTRHAWSNRSSAPARLAISSHDAA
jgi:hypothetical protein